MCKHTADTDPVIESEVTARLTSWRLRRPSVAECHCLDLCRAGTYCYRFSENLTYLYWVLNENVKKDFLVWEFQSYIYNSGCWLVPTLIKQEQVEQIRPSMNSFQELMMTSCYLHLDGMFVFLCLLVWVILTYMQFWLLTPLTPSLKITS